MVNNNLEKSFWESKGQEGKRIYGVYKEGGMFD